MTYRPTILSVHSPTYRAATSLVTNNGGGSSLAAVNLPGTFQLTDTASLDASAASGITISFAWNPDATTSVQYIMENEDGGTRVLSISLRSSPAGAVHIKGGDGTLVSSHSSTLSASAGTLRWFGASIDAGNRIDAYQADVGSAEAVAMAQDFFASSIALNTVDSRSIGAQYTATPIGATPYAGVLSHFAVYNTYMDMRTEANRRLFYSAAGELVSPPSENAVILFNGGVADWNTGSHAGSSADFAIVTGSVTGA